MTRIHKKLGFFTRNYYLIFGILWLGLGIIYLQNNNYAEKEGLPFDFFLVIFYVFLSSLYFYRAYRMTGNPGEFIEWNEDYLNYKQYQAKLKSYEINSLTAITLTENNLIIHAPQSRGIMPPLKGYSEIDIEKLRARFSSL